MGKTRYQADGFIPVNEPPARDTKLAAIVNIVKGDVLHDDGAGLAANAAVTFDSATFMGVAAADCNNSGNDGKSVEIYPFDSRVKYIVPVAANAEIAQTAIGSWVNLQANDDIDISDLITTGLGFNIDAIDISADAIVANTYGYAIGHFGLVVTDA